MEKKSTDIKSPEKKFKLDKEKAKTTALDFVLLLLACSSGTFATVSIMLPNGLTSGGLTGVVRIIQQFVDLDFSVIYYIASFAIVLTLGLLLGFAEAKKTLLLTFMYPTVMIFFEHLNVAFLAEEDVLLAAVFYGVFTGICSGIVIWRGYCFSGIDAIAKIIRKKLLPQLPQGKIMVTIDACIIIVSAFLFGRNIALYALITQYIVSKTIDTVIFGFESKLVQVEIITKDKVEPIVDFIIHDMDRSATTEKVIGEYTMDRYTKIRLYCSVKESIDVKKKLGEVDPKAFVSVIKVDTIWGHGKGFKSIYDDK